MRYRGFRILFAIAIAFACAVTPASGAQAAAAGTADIEKPPPRQYASGDSIRWIIPTAFPTSYPAQGDGILHVADMLGRVSDGRFVVELQPRGGRVRPVAITAAVQAGEVPAGYAWLAFDQERVPAAALFASMPFGMEPWEFVAWWFEGGGAQLARELYAPFGIHPILCGIAGPEAAGWFRREITSLDDLRRVRMRLGTGLSRRIIERLGVTTVALADDRAIMAAFNEDRIDAAEHSTPAVDATRAFATVVKNYYFPGWHQSMAALHFVVNAAAWKTLAPARQAQLEAACTAATLRTIATAEAAQGRALEHVQAMGVTLRRFPDAVLRALRDATEEVLSEVSATDAAFGRVLESQRAFRARHAQWKRLGYLPRDF